MASARALLDSLSGQAQPRSARALLASLQQPRPAAPDSGWASQRSALPTVDPRQLTDTPVNVPQTTEVDQSFDPRPKYATLNPQDNAARIGERQFSAAENLAAIPAGLAAGAIYGASEPGTSSLAGQILTPHLQATTATPSRFVGQFAPYVAGSAGLTRAIPALASQAITGATTGARLGQAAANLGRGVAVDAATSVGVEGLRQTAAGEFDPQELALQGLLYPALGVGLNVPGQVKGVRRAAENVPPASFNLGDDPAATLRPPIDIPPVAAPTRREPPFVRPVAAPTERQAGEITVYRGGDFDEKSEFNNWFTEDPTEAAKYGEVKAYKLRVKNPTEQSGGFDRRMLLDKGHDAAYIENPMSKEGNYGKTKRQWVVLDKSIVEPIKPTERMDLPNQPITKPPIAPEPVASQGQPRKHSYRSTHQIDQNTSRKVSDLPNIDDDVTRIRDKYGLTNYDRKDIARLKKIVGKPDADVVIYRASPVNELNSGDWVTNDPIYANDIKRQNGGKVYKYTVKARELHLPANLEDNPSTSRFAAFQYVRDETPPPTPDQSSAVGEMVEKQPVAKNATADVEPKIEIEDALAKIRRSQDMANRLPPPSYTKSNMEPLPSPIKLNRADWRGELYDHQGDYVGMIYKNGDNSFIVIEQPQGANSPTAVAKLPTSFSKSDFVKYHTLDVGYASVKQYKFRTETLPPSDLAVKPTPKIDAPKIDNPKVDAPTVGESAFSKVQHSEIPKSFQVEIDVPSAKTGKIRKVKANAREAYENAGKMADQHKALLACLRGK